MTNVKARQVQRTYLTLLLLNTLAASLIWGINTIFLLDAGLSNFEAFAANAFFTVGMMLFEIPTGVIADTKGRRMSYLLGTLTLILSTLLYLLMWHITAPFWAWAIASMLLGIGFSFFSGAVEAWLVDALAASDFKGKLESVFAKGEIAQGSAMLFGSVAGGFIAQFTSLGVPYILRAILLGVTFLLAFKMMRDIGFTPVKGKKPLQEMREILSDSVAYGLRNKSVRWIIFTAPFTTGVSIYVFYAMQPYLLELYGDPNAYGIAGIAASVVAAAQIAGGLVAPHVTNVFKRRTAIILASSVLSTIILLFIGLLPNFWLAVVLLVGWALLFALVLPVRQTYLNGLIPSKQRATVLSFDSLFGTGGGVVVQPLLGKSADIWNYQTSYLLSSFVQAFAVPFVVLAMHKKAASDTIVSTQDTK